MNEIKNIDEVLLEKIPEVLEKEGKLKTKILAEKLDEEKVGGKHYIKQRLHTHPEYFTLNSNNVESFLDSDETGGNDTRYWRLEE